MAHHRPAVRAVSLPSADGSSYVSSYLVLGPHLTLVDPGPGTAAAETALRGGMRDAGLRLEEVRNVFVTHSHVNHCGGAAWVLRECGARVVAHPTCLAAMTDWPASCRARAELLRRAGRASAVPPMMLEQAAERVLRHGESGSSIDEVSATGYRPTGHLRAGASTWNVLHTPGHTRDHQCLYHAASGVLVSGDVLTRDGTAVPWLESRKLDGSRPGTLSAQITSWRRLARLSVDLAWTGHGPPVRAHRMLVARRLADARSLIAGTRSALLEGAASVWDVMVAVHGRVDGATLAAALSQTVAALDWLVAKGEATRRSTGSLILYALTPDRTRR